TKPLTLSHGPCRQLPARSKRPRAQLRNTPRADGDHSRRSAAPLAALRAGTISSVRLLAPWSGHGIHPGPVGTGEPSEALASWIARRRSRIFRHKLRAGGT